MPVTDISAITLLVSAMPASYGFYRALGFKPSFGGPNARFSSFHAGGSYLNLALIEQPQTQWGRAIFYVDDVDAFYQNALEQGFTPSFEPSDADWGERYFHIRDPDGHELSFAKPLRKIGVDHSKE